MDEVWWNQITNARGFLQKIVAAALSGKSMVLVLPEQLPWRDTLFALVEQQLKDNDSSRSFACIRSPEQDIGGFLLREYCHEEKRREYRPTQSKAEFLAGCNNIVLNEKYLLVRDIPKQAQQEWAKFLRDYHGKASGAHAVFLLEARDGVLQSAPIRRVERIDYRRSIYDYDCFTFCALAASNTACESRLRAYLAELAYHLCGEDVELCARCIGDPEFLREPEEMLCRVLAEETRCDGHTFFAARESGGWMQRKIWEAQLKTIFPVIERFRSNFLARYANRVAQHLPIQNRYGEEWTEAEDVEIGTLDFMVRNQFFMVPAEDARRLNLFAKARNKLAHMKILELSAIEEILAAESV